MSSSAQSSRPSPSQATTTSATANKRARAPKGTNNWQEFAKENNGQYAGSAKGLEFTGYDRDGNAHRIVRPASTVTDEDDNDSDGTIADPKERARLEKEEVRIAAKLVTIKTDQNMKRDARSRFAKIPGGRNVPTVIPTYVGGKTVPKANYDYDDDGDDDDWGTL